MPNSYSTLVEGWRNCSFDSPPPHIFPEDGPILNEYAARLKKPIHSFEDYIASDRFGIADTKLLHFGLLPVPYAGNLQRASIFILMLNPGFSPGDYFAEQCSPEFRSALIRNIQQKNDDDDYPFVFLNPQFAWHPGFMYWQPRLHPFALLVKQGHIQRYQEALSYLAKHVACLELVPYHSKAFGSSGLLNRLHSTKTMLAYVRNVLVPRAQAGEATIIAMRGAGFWNLPAHPNIVVYEKSQTRSAYLTPDAGKQIVRRLGLQNIE